MKLSQESPVSPASLLPAPEAIRAGAVQARDRVEALDVVRGIALFGVLIVNLITEFRISIFQQLLGAASEGSGIDRTLAQIVSAALESKAFALFSLLFGVGLAIQFDRLAIRGRPLYWLVRRLLVLLVFGATHLLLIWNGDILTEYAIVGLLVLPFLYLKSRHLAGAALILLFSYIAQSSMPWSIQWPAAPILEQHVVLANTIYATAGYVDIVHFSHRELALLLPLHLYVLPRTISLFLFGMFFWRTGVFTHPAKFKVPVRIAALLGVLGGAAILVTDGSGFSTAWPPLLKECSRNIAQIMLTFGYGATILILMGFPPARNILEKFAPLGRMAFTNYLMQSLICGFIFFGYGCGRFGNMAVAPAIALGLTIYVMQVMLSIHWLRYFRFGPMEWLWRTLMYGKLQPMRNGRP